MKRLAVSLWCALAAAVARGSPPPAGVVLPVPCAVGGCGTGGPSQWVASGAATAVQSGNVLTVTQSSQNAVLNWQSFNVSSNGTVTFKQPGASSIALNQIFQSDPSRILGALNANGSVYLINQNGIVFGSGAQVNVGSLVASSLAITPQALGGILQAAQSFKPAFQQATDANGNLLPAGNVEVQAGASVLAPGGQILLLAPQVTNAGTVRADGGQVIFAAGDSVYLAGSSDPNLRGLVVEVGHGGTVTNQAGGLVAASEGNVSLVGQAVNQLGRVSATTSVRANGSVYLLAQDGATVQNSAAGVSLGATHGGTLQLGAASQTEVALALNDPATTVDATPQPHSVVLLTGQTVSLAGGSEITAHSGSVSIVAAEAPGIAAAGLPPTPSAGRLLIADGARIDVSGANIDLPMESNVIAVQLRGTELADSPLQRNGPLRGQTVYVDVRQSGTLANGSAWFGSPIGDLSGYVAAVPRGVGARNLAGGLITLSSDGAVLVSSHATLDISGGTVNYASGYINTTKVLGTNGVVYDIAQADPNQSYVGIVSTNSTSNPKWGATQQYPTFSADPRGTFEAGYVQGYDAGAVTIVAPAAVFDGSIVAATVAGPQQRQLPTPVSPTALYRPVNQAPLGGTLTIGVATPADSSNPNYVEPNVTFARGTVLDGLMGPGGAPFDPLSDPLPASLATVRLNPDLLGAGRVANLAVFANGTVSVPADVALALPSAGSLRLRAASIDIEGNIGIPSGTVSVTAAPTATTSAASGTAALTLGATAVLDVAGTWINDLPAGATAPGSAELATRGGSVTLVSSGGTPLALEPGSVIDASGGALRSATGQVTAGAAGSIAISVGPSTSAQPVPVTVGSELRGFGLQSGGSLAITANRVCIAAIDCTGGDASTLWVSPALFSLDGFAKISLASNLGGLEVAPGTVLEPRQLNYVLTGDAAGVATGAPLAALASPTLLPDLLRQPMSVSLRTNVVAPDFQPFTAATFANAGELTVGHGASISLDRGGALSLISNSSIVIDGTLSAPAGSITVATTAAMTIDEFQPSQGIWLLDSAKLLAPGAAQLQVDDLGRVTGTVLNGGAISVIANRGYLMADPLSVIDASGTAANLDITTNGALGQPLITRTAIGSSGGTIYLAAAEGMQLSGQLAARAGAGAGASGGTLSVTLDGNLHGFEPLSSGAPIFPLNPRELVISGSVPVVFAPNAAVPAAWNGIGSIPAATIQNGGFASLVLVATDLYDALGPNASGIQSVGSIVFPQNTALSVPASLRLLAPEIVATNGVSVSLAAAYVALGSDDSRVGAQDPVVLAPGSAVLSVSADLVDLIGTVGLSGISSTRISSTGDIRARGVEISTGTQQPIAGELQALGDLTLAAAQIYPTTLSQYRIVAEGVGSTLTVLPGGTASSPLSAGGSLTLQADTIEQSGVLRAPFGRIALSGNSITLADGSVTSTSGAGLTIPFGATQAGADWVYALPAGQTHVYTGDGPPAKSIALSGSQISVAKGATVDLSGGGDLQAAEFVPGVGGTVDVLSGAVNSRQFAILPQAALAFAPFDPQSSAGFGYATGTTVVLGAGSGVPAGTYAVLPARYALLPGGFLVTPVSGFADLPSGQAIVEPGGGTVVAGQFGLAGVGVVQPRTSGFSVLPGFDVQQLAQYSLALATQFFGASPKQLAGAVAPQLPTDAGQLQLLAGSALQFLGTLVVSPAAGGRGAEVDISATSIEIAASDGTPGGNGAVVLSASQLNGLGAQSLLIGGVRTSYSGAVGIDTTASTVSVDPGVTLSGPEVLLTARDGVSLGAGATLSAKGANTAPPATVYNLSGGGAFLRVSTGGQALVAREALDGATGDLTIAAGATLEASGSAVLEASGNLQSAADYKLAGAALAFVASQITLGGPGTTGAGLVLNPADLSPLGLKALSLTSATSIAVAGPESLTVDGNLTLRTGAIDALTADAALSVQAKSITLAGAGVAGAAAPLSSTGSLTLKAGSLALDGGSISVSGFATTTLDAATQIRATADGALTADHQLTLATALIEAGDGVSFALRSGDQLSAVGPSTSAQGSASAPGSGGSLSLTGSGVTIDTAIALPTGGRLTVAATGSGDGKGVAIGSAARIDAAGRTTVFDGLAVDGRGGRLDITVAAGDLTMASGAVVDVSGAGASGAGGEISIITPAGSATLGGVLAGHAGTGATGATFALEAAHIADLGALNTQLNGGGFGGERRFTQTGAGDLVLASGATIRAGQVTVSNDGGAIDLLGSIDASGGHAGSVLVAAASGVRVEGSIDVHGADATPGRIQLDTRSGAINLTSSSIVNFGAAGGSLELRTPRSSLLGADGSVAPQIALQATFVGSPAIRVEGFETYAASGGVVSSGDVAASSSNPLYADAAAFMQSAPAIVAALHAPAGATVSIVPGVEIDAASDLTVASNWNLNTWRFNGAPGVLTLRAAGNLVVQGSISDGFTDVTGAGAFTLPSTPDQSWSYRLVAGATLGASDPLAVGGPGTMPAGSGNILISAGTIDQGPRTPPTPTMVRTGTGSIDIAAAGDLAFGNRASVVYTAGANSDAGVPLANLASLAYPTRGGDISIRVGGDVVGAPTNQLVTSWLWRTGQGAAARFPSATGWTVNYQWFEQNIGALGGGAVTVAAGGDIRELSVAIPTIGRQVGGTTAAENSVLVTGGGQLRVESGGSILGGSYYVGQGTGVLTAWGGVGRDSSGRAGSSGLAPLLALGDATVQVAARDGVQIEDVVNPTLLPQATAQPTTARSVSVFSTYSDQSAVDLMASAGDVVLVNQPGRAGGVEDQLSAMPFGSIAQAASLLIYPGSLNAEALAGNVRLEGQLLALWPAPRGALNLLASESVRFDPQQQLLMADVNPTTLPSASAPSANLTPILGLFAAPANGLAYTPIHSAGFGPSAQQDPDPVRIVALTGDVANAGLWFLPKATHIVAGGDITGLYLRAENVGSADQTVVSAGGNVEYSLPRDPNLGLLLPDSSGVVLEGPGTLLVTAGGSVNLGTSSGFTTVGNLYNPSNATAGAGVTVLAGLTAAKADLKDFVQTYLASSSVYDAQLLAFVNARAATPIATKAAALAAFTALPAEQQFALCEQIMVSEVRLGGVAAAAAGPHHDDYSRSFAALSALFPGATDSSPAGAQALYPGSISLYFSRIYTLDGGDVTLLAPGGAVNVGISTPPLAFGLSKQPSDLGIVAESVGNVSSVSYGDFLVNQSRVFAADGGDILVWSTEGNIDAGRGAKTAISAPPPTITFNAQGQIVTVFPAALQGSGIQALAVSAGVEPGSVDLFAPHGVVNAGDAGIVAGNLTIGATAVLGRDNIAVSGVSVGVPVETTGLGASIAGSSSVSSSSTNVAAGGAESATRSGAAPIAETAMSWLDVFVTGLGEDDCRPDDLECLKRQKKP